MHNCIEDLVQSSVCLGTWYAITVKVLLESNLALVEMVIEMLTVSSCSNDKPSFRSTPWKPPNKAGLINRPPIRPCVRVSVHPSTKSFFNLNEIWYFGRD